ncbi:tetratricopeptide repeat protein [Thioalkalivibrio paradoxus]|uniref:protein O-GlcNAc transferase n=1 Tax=Thioalkalivibrio paradoxus ARh 1 TaxID=713585 RepID=W0DJC3_9GAMM|nr:tetratricopeptide repeat protein [Thioalkalivibrio paradoxus]AHE98551.1 hypothetical protein THITH_10145 [Thioalkalivibrio paradoxus ARh 1]
MASELAETIGAALEDLQRGQFHEAASRAQRCIDAHPENADAWHLRAMARRELGELEGAVADLEQCLRLEPANSMAWLHLGQVHARQRELKQACDAYARAADADPGNAEACFWHGRCELEAGRAAAAAMWLERAARGAPGAVLLRAWAALALARSGRMTEAAAWLDGIEEAAACDGETWFQLGRALAATGRVERAERAYREALERGDVARGAVLNNLGLLLRDSGRRQEAAGALRSAVAADSGNWRARGNLALAYLEQGRIGNAQREVDALNREFPDAAGVWAASGVVYERQDRIDAALTAYQRAIDLGDRSPAVRRARLRMAQSLCDWRSFDEDRDWLRQQEGSDYADVLDLFGLMAVPGLTDADLAERTRPVGERLARTASPSLARQGPAAAPPRTRLRVAYLSGDFHEHATAWLMAGVFELHDRNGFEIIAYSFGPDDGSTMRRRLETAFDRFHDVSALDDRAVAQRIADDGIDILVDLKGYTRGARPLIAAYRPAPIQVNYLGYPGTMGAPFMDYLIADRIVLPREQFAHFSERAAWLPGTYQCNDRAREVGAPTTRAEQGLSEAGPVLCGFHNPYKVTPTVFDAWCRLLRDSPDAVLWLLEPVPAVAANLRREAEQRGVDPGRLVFAPRLRNPEHLARLALADLFLDTLPVNAHTTASDALWVGVPVLTCTGETFAGRVGASLLAAAGLSELVTDSLETYEAKAQELLENPDRLAELKMRLNEQRDHCRLFDTKGFTRNLERLYRAIWERHRAGLPPAPIE